MYRTRVEAVSGTRVFADGKWLKCIGNKRFSVGERIWTDGRCVYGNLQESEQPKVIVASEDEGIPIVVEKRIADLDNESGWELFTFEHNKLKRVAAICRKDEDSGVDFYKDVAGKLKFVEAMPDTDKWTDFTLMINDDKRAAWLYDAGSHYKEGFYGRHDDYDASNDFCTDTELLATNIAKNGTRFDMVLRYESGQKTFGGTMEKYVAETRLEILENGAVVKSVDLNDIIDAAEAATPEPENIWWPPESNAYNVGYSLSVLPPFIENSQRWYVGLCVRIRKSMEFNDAPPVDTEETGYGLVGGRATASLSCYYLITPDGKKIISEELTQSELHKNPDIWGHPMYIRTWYPKQRTKASERITLPLQDGYHCDMYDFFTAEDYYSEVDNTVVGFTPLAYAKFYSPRGKELFNCIANPLSPYPICRVGAKYLLAASGVAPPDKDTNDGVLRLERGLYLIAGGRWERLEDCPINEFLLPMKKIKGWQNRLKLLDVDQKEI